jgi:hypothetical protein
LKCFESEFSSVSFGIHQLEWLIGINGKIHKIYDNFPSHFGDFFPWFAARRFVMTSLLVVLLYPGDPAQVAAGPATVLIRTYIFDLEQRRERESFVSLFHLPNSP